MLKYLLPLFLVIFLVSCATSPQRRISKSSKTQSNTSIQSSKDKEQKKKIAVLENKVKELERQKETASASTKVIEAPTEVSASKEVRKHSEVIRIFHEVK